MNDADGNSAGRRTHGAPTNVLFDAWRVSRSVHRLIDVAIEESGLDADEFAIYSVLASGDGLTPSELAHWMAAAPTTVSSYVKRFERRGHVSRIANAEDRRSYRVQLTAAGRAAHQHCGSLFAPVLAQTEDALGAHADAAHAQLRELLHAVDTVRDEYAEPTARRQPDR